MFNNNHRKLVTVIALVAIALCQGFQAGASAQPAAANLSAEKQTLASFANDLNSFEKKIAELQKKPRITASELGAAKVSAGSLKTKLPQIQQTFRSAVDKLKAAKEWDNFDAAILAKFNKPKAQSFIRTAGGAKQVLEGAAQLSGLAAELDESVKSLNAKVAFMPSDPWGNEQAQSGFQFVSASFAPPATAVKESFKCRLRIAIYVIRGTDSDFERMACACDPGCTTT